MPYPGEHAARINDPDKYDLIRRQKDKFGPGIDVIFGVITRGREDRPAEVQAIRFDKTKFTPAEAKAWLNEHDYKPVEFEPASGPTALSVMGGEIETLAAAVRRETFEGREHVVAPVVMLVEGVHRDLYYPASELADTPETWNGIPVTVNHPLRNGVPISANEPGVIDKAGIGRVFNSRWEGGKLRAEAWVDVAKAEKVSPEILAAIHNGAPLEVSTGVYTNDDGVKGEWNGEAYRATARGYRPNHLALLPDGQGACNWQDGCGIRLNGSAACAEMNAGETGSAKPTAVEGSEASVPAQGAGAGQLQSSMEGRDMDRNEAITKLIECKCSRFVANDRAWLESLTDEQLTAAADLTPVEPPAPAATPEPPAAAPVTLTAETPKIEFKPPAAPVVLTAEQYVAQAPPAVAGVLRRALAREQAEKDSLVASLVANQRNRFPKDALEAKDIEELKAMADLAAITVNYAGQAGGAMPQPKSGPPPMPAVFEFKS
jgi:hypothetical protein